MKPMELPPEHHLGAACRDLVVLPHRTLFPAWSWKAASLIAIVRGVMFFTTHLHDGRQFAVRGSLVEAVFAIFAAGLLGAVSQRLRRARPFWATALVVWIALPALLLLAELAVHHAANYPHLTLGLFGTYCFAAVSTAYGWYAMRHGALLGGADRTTLGHDARALPGITRDFLLAGPRYLLHHRRQTTR